nr:putative RNA-directed DNA polymerase, eukaryota, reverse transcriptase zinc-binding domain protein [Tanacetum cinerariifolium]
MENVDPWFLKSAYGSVLVNGSPTKEFKIEKGLRQGDPLSPFLFLIAVKALHVSLQEAKSKNLFEGIKVGSLEVEISHLQFADDAFIMGKWSIKNANNLCRILRCFNLASGLKVNFSKSKFFGVGVDTNETRQLASILKFQPSSLPCSYLGLPIGSNMNNAINWKHVIDKFHKRLTSWKAKTLSYGGRLTLLKSVLGALDTYIFSIFKAPNLHALNLAMLSKWWWRFHLEKNSLWSLIIISIHGSHGRLTSDFPTEGTPESLCSHDCIYWKLINHAKCWTVVNFNGSKTRSWAWRRPIRGGHEETQFINLLSLLEGFETKDKCDA